jgi:proline iminopeptidase
MKRRFRSEASSVRTSAPGGRSPGRSAARNALLAVLTVLAVIAGWAAAVIVFFAVAGISSSIPVLLAAAVCACLLVTAGACLLVARLARVIRTGRYPACTSLAGTALLAVACSATVLQPLPSTPGARQAPIAPAGVRYWDLPTGSRLAYLELPARRRARPDPVIFVGGGPGEEDVADTSQTQFFGQLARLGYDVYFYDQLGSGLSERLADPAGYTVARQVADLEAIRERIGARQVILLGSSWGGTLAASYMASHPHDVAKAVFTSPAPIDFAQWPDFGSVTSRLPPAQRQRADALIPGDLRFLAWYGLGLISPTAAHHLVPDAEADAFFSTFLRLADPGTVCDPARLPHQPQTGNGLYDNIFTTRNAQHTHADTREILASDHTPALILTGGCNYINWGPTWGYKTTLPDATLICFPDAGHVIYLDQPRPYLAAIQAFLLGKPLPMRARTTSRPCQHGAS